MEELLDRMKQYTPADGVRMCFNWGQDLSRLEGDILFEEIDKLRALCRLLASETREGERARREIRRTGRLFNREA